jgi:hypothetical protein
VPQLCYEIGLCAATPPKRPALGAAQRVSEILRSFSTSATSSPTESLCYASAITKKDRNVYPEPSEKNQDYREVARNIRSMAREMHDREAQAQLLLIASLYDKLADLSNTLIPSLEAKLSDIFAHKISDRRT